MGNVSPQTLVWKSPPSCKLPPQAFHPSDEKRKRYRYQWCSPCALSLSGDQKGHTNGNSLFHTHIHWDEYKHTQNLWQYNTLTYMNQQICLTNRLTNLERSRCSVPIFGMWMLWQGQAGPQTACVRETRPREHRVLSYFWEILSLMALFSREQILSQPQEGPCPLNCSHRQRNQN